MDSNLKQDETTHPNQFAGGPADVVARSILIVSSVIAGILMVLWVLERTGLMTLPGAMVVPSRGTRYAAFSEFFGGFANAATSLGLVLLAWVTCKLLPRQSTTIHTKPPQNHFGAFLAASAAGVVSGAGWWYLSSWPYAFPSNARMHWVDALDASDRLQFTYWLTDAAHVVFYEHPAMFTAVCGRLAAAFMAATLLQMGVGRVIAAVGATTLFLGPQLSTFANMAEDVPVVLAATCLALACFVGGRGWAFGLACGLLVLARPQTGLLFVAGIVAWAVEQIVVMPNRQLRAGLWRMVWNPWPWSALGAWLAVLVPPHLWMFGHDLGLMAGPIDMSMYKAIEIEGFRIHDWSGAFVLHALWMTPAVMLGSGLIALTIPFRQPAWSMGTRVVVMAVLYIAGTLILYEQLAMSYFNWRYLAYLLPVMSLLAFVPVVAILRRPFAFGPVLAVVVALAPMAASGGGFAALHKARTHPFTPIWTNRDAVRLVTDGSPVYFMNRGRTQKLDRNQLCYLLRKHFRDVKPFEEGRNYPLGTLLICTTADRRALPADKWTTVADYDGAILMRKEAIGGVGEPD